MKKVTLHISQVENKTGEYLVVVNGEDFFESANKKVGARIRGDDVWFDDHLFGIGGIGGVPERVGRNGRFTLTEIVPGSLLNEDWGRDEIYALVDVDGLSGTFKSNKIKDYF